jgi:hypothetical protein
VKSDYETSLEKFFAGFIGVDKSELPALFIFKYVDLHSSLVYKYEKKPKVEKMDKEDFRMFLNSYLGDKLFEFYKSEPIPDDDS